MSFDGLYINAVGIKAQSLEPAQRTRYPVGLFPSLLTEHIPFRKPVTFFVGDNGSGKSTLIEAIAIIMGFNAEGGTRNFRFSTRGSHSELVKHLYIDRGLKKPRDGFFLRAESFFNVATNIEELDRERSFGGSIIDSYGGVSLHEQSHGESFLALMNNRFDGHGLYILDEPEAALSPVGQLSMLNIIHRLVENEGSQFIIATHSPLLTKYPNADIFQFGGGEIKLTPYAETDLAVLYKDFLANDRLLTEMLKLD
ncbi:MAG: AAA family ATPase [Oscillospiraceae bacterium]|jgi:predicted ATPase|nr:AAA family ATPase [Oscillospiraceae bacterium]